ncbi:hypothetical protein SLS64_008202 [Diaporthe eres]|uniref:Uncharacterized protein n=1 Tax=Diaporthe eres TaxID=83184 RepID=A0ABR1PK41_DIAER
MITNLNPSEDYKTSVLSGLSPEAIMECAGRALSFWSYQMTQDLKNEDLTQAYKEKNRKLLQTQELYDKLKRKAMLGHIQDAASDAVDTTLQGTSSYAAQQADQGVYEHQIGTPLRTAQAWRDRLLPRCDQELPNGLGYQLSEPRHVKETDLSIIMLSE